jgi:hypothetical protein
MVAYTTTYNLKKPTVADDEDVWGGYLNDSMDLIDDVLDGTTPVTGIDINSGTIDNAVIGGTTAVAGTFSTLTANTSLGVTGNITVSGTVDGVDIAARDAILTSTTTTADAALPKAGGTMTGAITFAAGQSFDGRDVSADGSKLDGIESGATADQTASEILTAIKTVDGSGSGLDADLWDGNQFSSYLNQAVLSTSSPSFAGLNINGNLNAVDNVYLAGSLYHEGDTDTRLLFGTNTITLQTGGSSEITVNTTGVRLGDTGNGYFRPVSGNYGSIEIDGGGHNTWEGYSIGGRAVFMHDNSSYLGLYDDVNNHWAIRHYFNGTTELYYDGSSKLQTTSSGANVDGTLSTDGLTVDGTTTLNGTLTLGANVINDVEDIYLRDRIYHDGDTNTYIQFHATDQWRVVTGGSERLEVNNTRTFIDRLFVDAGVVEDYEGLSGTSPTCNVNNGGAFALTMTGNTTFTFTAPWDTGNSTGFVLELTGNGSTVTWPSSVDWAGGTAPDAPASGETDIYVFWTRNGGTTWYGVQSIDAAA